MIFLKGSHKVMLVLNFFYTCREAGFTKSQISHVEKCSFDLQIIFSSLDNTEGWSIIDLKTYELIRNEKSSTCQYSIYKDDKCYCLSHFEAIFTAK